MKNRNKYSTPNSAPSQKGNFSKKKNDNYTDLLRNSGNNFQSRTKVINDSNNRKYNQEMHNKNNSNLIKDPKTMILGRLSLSNENLKYSPPISTYKSYTGFNFSKKFVESRFIDVDKTITLSQLETILQFFTIIDHFIDEKPLIYQKIIPLCQIDEQTYDSCKLKEALLLSFKKSTQSSFWSEIANCITSARMNGKKSSKSPNVHVRCYSKSDPPKKRPKSNFLREKSSIKRAIQFEDDLSYTSGNENPEKTKTTDLLSEISEDYSDTTIEFKKLEEKKSNKNKNDEDFDYSEVDGKTLDDLLNESDINENLFSTDNVKILFSSETSDQLPPEKVRSRKKQRKQNRESFDLLENKDNDNFSEYEYIYYSDEQVVKSKLTFDDLIKQEAGKRFNYKEFQKIAKETKLVSSSESIEYDENDEDLFIRTKRRWKHRHRKSNK